MAGLAMSNVRYKNLNNTTFHLWKYEFFFIKKNQDSAARDEWTVSIVLIEPVGNYEVVILLRIPTPHRTVIIYCSTKVQYLNTLAVLKFLVLCQ